MPETETETTERPDEPELAVEESAQEPVTPEAPTSLEAPGSPVDAPPAPEAQGPVLKPAGVWADELRVADWRFNAANLVERWLATPRTAITRRGRLEPGRDLTREQLEQGLARVDSVSCR